MHLKVADELEERSSNVLFEKAEVLAHHFAAGGNATKAFHYLAMAAHKSLNVYAIAEAEGYFRKALAIFEQNPSCADPPLASPVVVGLLETLMLKSDYRELGDRREVYARRQGGRRDAGTGHRLLLPDVVAGAAVRAAGRPCAHDRGFAVAERLGDGRARAFARAGLLHCRTRLGLDTFEEAERRKAEVMEDCRTFDDNFLRNSAYFVHHSGTTSIVAS